MSASGKLLFVLGTRPEAIKLAPLIHMAHSTPGIDARVVSTGQHREMLKPILQGFSIKPDYDLQLMTPGQNLATLQARISESLTEILLRERPDWLIVQGDTQTCMAAALTSYLLRVPVAHVEAGLRTHDMNSPWPEEFNRRVAALCAQIHFAPTETARGNLLRESIAESAIYVTGNSGIDAQLMALDILGKDVKLKREVESCLPSLPEDAQVVLATVHRREAHGAPLEKILRAILQIAEAREHVQVLLPVHKNPVVRESVMKILGRAANPRIHLLQPLDYFPFLLAMNRATLILTDSGGVQEEAPTLRKPVLVLRETTERAEAVEAGCAKLVGFDESRIVTTALDLLDHSSAREAMFAKGNPFGDGQAASRIMKTLWNQQERKTGS